MVKKIGKYELGSTLGSGTFGKVKKAIDTEDPKKSVYAIKVLERKQIEKENMQEQLKNEIAIMKILKHTHIVKMFEVIQSPQHIYIVLELITGGELFDRIVAAKRFDETTARRYFQQLIFGIYYCHQQGVSHRDLKPENLLLDNNDNLKISDFGLSAISQVDNEKDKLLTTTCGTPNYVAPEVLKEKGYNGMTADIWSCGVILFVMLAGYLPFDDPTMNGLFVKIERGDYRIPKGFSEPVKTLIRKMLTVDPAKRITVDGILEDPWFIAGLEPGAIEKQKVTGKVEVGSQEVQNAVSDVSNATVIDSGGKAQLASHDTNAFELASRLVMGSLSPLARDGAEVTIRRNTQFVANGGIDTIFPRVEGEVKKLNCQLAAGKQGDTVPKQLKAYFNLPKGGVVTYNIVFLPTVAPDLTLCEVRRVRGDTLEFQVFYRKLVRLLADVVPKQPPAEEELPQE